MADLIELLKRFNRKERYFLIRQALDLPQKDFRLSDEFREKLGCQIDTTIPEDAFAAMDYHLDWIAAGLRAYRECIPMDKISCEIFSNQNENNMVKGNQQDVDFLIAFKRDGFYHLILMEAKGYAYWNKEQMHKKVKHLKAIFADSEVSYPNVKKHFCLLSGTQPSKSTTDGWTEYWPEWMTDSDERPHWLELSLLNYRLKVTRCNFEGKSSQDGKHFRIVNANP